MSGCPTRSASAAPAAAPRRVVVYSYGRGADLWWKQSEASLARSDNLEVIDLPQASTQGLARLAKRTMQLNCTIQDGQVWLADEDESVQVETAMRLPTAV